MEAVCNFEVWHDAGVVTDVVVCIQAKICKQSLQDCRTTLKLLNSVNQLNGCNENVQVAPVFCLII